MADTWIRAEKNKMWALSILQVQKVSSKRGGRETWAHIKGTKNEAENAPNNQS